MLTPMEIHNKDFKRSFRGYDEDEIDSFLDQVVNDYEKLYRDNERLRDEAQQQQEAIAQYKKLEQNIKDTLLVAQKTAEEVTANAHENAEKQLANAAKECQNMRRETELRAEKVKAETDAKIRQRLSEATERLHGVVSEYDRLVREKSQFLQRMQHFYTEELAHVQERLDRMPNAVQAEVADGGASADTSSAAEQPDETQHAPQEG